MEFIEFVEKFVELKNINLLPYQKEVIKQISQAIKEGNEIKIYCLASYGESFYKELLEALSQMLDEKLDNKLDEKLNPIKKELNEINKKLDGKTEQTADLVEFRNEILNKIDGIREDLSTVELVTANNYKDIAKLKAVK